MVKTYLFIVFWILSLIFTAIGMYYLYKFKQFIAMSSDRSKAAKVLIKGLVWILVAVIMMFVGFVVSG